MELPVPASKKAKKAGVNQKVDGLEFYVEDLATTNSSVNATISKLISAGVAAVRGFRGVCHCQRPLGRRRPDVWPWWSGIAAVRRGGQGLGGLPSRRQYVEAISEVISAAADAAAFQNLCGLVSPEPEPEVDPNKVIPLRLLESTPVENPSSDRLAALEDELNNLSLEELTRRVKPNDDGD